MMIKQKGKNKLEINRIGNKNCWIKIWFQHRGLINTAGLLILGDHLFLNYKKKMGRGGWLIPRGLLILCWHYIYWLVVWNIFPYFGINNPNWLMTNIFRRVAKNHQSVYTYIYIYIHVYLIYFSSKIPMENVENCRAKGDDMFVGDFFLGSVWRQT